jgi:hypothetical protein
MLVNETRLLAQIAGVLGQPQERERLESEAAHLRLLAEECWDDSAVLYRYRDRISHRCQAGKSLGSRRGAGNLTLNRSFQRSVRLLVRIDQKGESTRHPEIILHGQDGEASRFERLERVDFQWGMCLAVATTSQLYTRLDEIEISGVEKHDRVSLQIMDFSGEDVTLFLPLLAKIPDPQRARALIGQTLLEIERFGRPFGIPTCASPSPIRAARQKEPDLEMNSVCQAVHLPWNALIAEGFLAYGMREEAAQLIARLMAAVIQNLKQRHAFFRAYHGETGAGMGERNSVQGLAPLGLFLETLGVVIHSPRHVTLAGKNPFPWPVTVKYRGLTVTRQAEQSVIVFPDGRTITLNDPTEAVVSAE